MIKINTIKVKTNNSWYGKYQLVRTKKNLNIVKKIIENHLNNLPTKTADS